MYLKWNYFTKNVRQKYNFRMPLQPNLIISQIYAIYPNKKIKIEITKKVRQQAET